jgi:hypothetical protein
LIAEILTKERYNPRFLAWLALFSSRKAETTFLIRVKAALMAFSTNTGIK